ncbi:hypothetical protein [Gordonia sp. NPDC003585]|uniref:hypothetical protein n=1 Tax=Gordonia sp. NPDC003585 TaxID=3154275 RepID=UPI0033ACE0FB
MTGPVGLRILGRSRLFRYEIRCWRDGPIPDLAYAIASHSVPDDETVARSVVELTASVPAHVWGRRAPGTSEMWNSNAVLAWLLTASGVDTEDAGLPDGCRAPGWRAGIDAATRAAP